MRALLQSGAQDVRKTALAMATGVGVVNDLVSPVLSVAWWLAGIVGGVAVLSGAVVGLKRWKGRGRVEPAEHSAALVERTFHASTVATLVFVAAALISGSYPNEGFLAAKVPAIEDVQRAVLRLDASVARVERTSETILDRVSRLDAKFDSSLATLNASRRAAGAPRAPSAAGLPQQAQAFAPAPAAAAPPPAPAASTEGLAAELDELERNIGPDAESRRPTAIYLTVTDFRRESLRRLRAIAAQLPEGAPLLARTTFLAATAYWQLGERDAACAGIARAAALDRSYASFQRRWSCQ